MDRESNYQQGFLEDIDTTCSESVGSETSDQYQEIQGNSFNETISDEEISDLEYQEINTGNDQKCKEKIKQDRSNIRKCLVIGGLVIVGAMLVIKSFKRT